jgi:hypothetical protein
MVTIWLSKETFERIFNHTKKSDMKYDRMKGVENIICRAFDALEEKEWKK